MSEAFDVIVIGSGPGGYSAAIRCAQKGISVALIEKSHFGGTCLNRGCIPSKALLASAHTLLAAKHASLMGIDIPSAAPNWPNIQKRKNAIVAGFRNGLAGLVKANKIKIYNGTAVATAPSQIAVQTENGQIDLTAKNIIIATGSKPIEISAFPFDGNIIISSKEALALDSIPQSMLIVGGGVIGCELACVYANVGTKVTIAEALDRLLPNEDKWVGQLLEREFKKAGIDVLTGQQVNSVDTSAAPAKVNIGDDQIIEAEKVLVMYSRRMNI